MITKNGTVIKFNTFNIEGKCSIQIISKNTIKHVKLNVLEEKTNKNFTYESNGNSSLFTYSFQIENPVLWSISDPKLYRYNLEINYDGETECVDDTFAFRTINSNGRNILINGNPIFVRGYIRGAKAHEHANNCGLSNREFYEKNILEAKKYGFNLVRFHSIIPEDEFFEEADKLGMLIHIELRLPTDSYNNLEEMVNCKDNLIEDEFILNVIDRLYNHPSLCVYCIGNELKSEKLEKRIEEIGKLIKETDSSRLYIDTCAWGKFNRKHIDIDVQHMGYYFPFDSHSEIFSDAKSVHTLLSSGVEIKDGVNPYKVPLIAHEVCHYTALRDFEGLRAKFKKQQKEEPWWIEEELKLIKTKGLSDNYNELYRASKYFQLQCWKVAFESLRSSELLSGFHFLQFADTDVYENSNGVVDCFDDENFITPNQFNVFNGDMVLLSSLKEKLFTSGEEKTITFSLSNYCETQFENVKFICEITDGENVYLTKVFENLNVDKSGIIELCKFNFTVPNVISSKKLVISAKLENKNNVIASNSWNIWAYEKQDKLSYQDFVNYAKENVVITDDISCAFESLKNKKKVCLIYRSDWTRHVANKTMSNPNYSFNATWNRFKPVIWDRGTNFGGLCNDKLLCKYGFVSDKIYDFNYCKLTEDCDKIILDTFPIKTTSIISGIDKNVRDRFDVPKTYFGLSELQYDRTLRDFSYLFEIKVDGASLLVCGLNLTGLDNNEPSSLCMAKFIINYLNSNDFNPSQNIKLSELQDYMTKCAKQPVKERMMTQFWELDDAPVETKQYWEQSKEYLIK